MTLANTVLIKAEEVLSLDGMDGTHPEGFMYEFCQAENYYLVHIEDYGDSRWESHEGYVFRLPDDSYIEFGYASGLTEMQDHHGIESVSVVEPYELVTVKYRSVK